MSSRHFNHNPVNGEGRAPSRPPRLPTYLHTEVVSARRAMYPRRPRRGTSERGRVATCCDRLGDRPTPNRNYPSLRPVNTEHAEARRHGGFLELAYAHPNHFMPDLDGKKRPNCAMHVLIDLDTNKRRMFYLGGRLSPTAGNAARENTRPPMGNAPIICFHQPGLFCVARRAFLCVLW